MGDVSLFKEEIIGKENSENTCFIWWLNIGVDSMWNLEYDNLLPRLKNEANAQTVNRTEQLSLLLADENDIVIMREEISDIVRKNLILMGISLPQIWVPKRWNGDEQYPISELIIRDNELLNKIKKFRVENEHKDILLVPYAVTYLEEQIALKTGCKLLGASSEMSSWVNSKVNARLLAEELKLPVTKGYICNSIKEVENAIKELKTNDDAKIAVKEAYGASGKGFYVIDSRSSLNFLLTILTRKKNSNKKINVIVEQWYDTLFDINYQIFIKEDGKIQLFPLKKQIMKREIYIGSDFPINHFLSKSQNEFYTQEALKIGQSLWQKGYRGLASIDSIIASGGTIFPVIEINGRFTLSTYISFIPDLIGRDKKYRTRYYNVNERNINELVYTKLEEWRYSSKREEGVFVYSVARGSVNNKGRLFLLLVAKDIEKLNYIEEEINKLFYDS